MRHKIATPHAGAKVTACIAIAGLLATGVAHGAPPLVTPQPIVAHASAIPAGERTALMDLYTNTRGPGWNHKTNWNGAAGTECTWFGVLCDAGQTTVLQLSLAKNNLVGTLPATLGGLTNLQYLALQNNQVRGSIHAALGSLTNLRYLGLSSNQLVGRVPSTITNLTSLGAGNCDFRWNGLYSADPTVVAFLNGKQTGGDWQSTQTVPVTGLALGVVTTWSVALAWTPIAYTTDTGGYEVFYATTLGGPYTLSGTTANKSTTEWIVSGLAAGTPYYFVVKSVTNAHAHNQATVVSDPTAEVPGTVAACALSIASFTASPGFVNVAGTSTLSWSTSGATGVTLDGRPVAATGSKVVTPDGATTYTLVAKSECGSTSSLVTVNVNTGSAKLGVPTISAPRSGQTIGVAGVSFAWNQPSGASRYDMRLFDGTGGATIFTGSLVGRASTSTVITLANGSYLFAVRACSGFFSDTTCGHFATVPFTVKLAAPSQAPTITAPSAGASLTSSTQSFSWTPVVKAKRSPALSYEVLLTDVAASSTELQITVPDPTTSTSYSLHSSTHYRLAVRACEAGCGPYSTPVDFDVSLPPVPAIAPTISSADISGGHSATSGASSLTTCWVAVPGADFYDLQVLQPLPAGPGGGALAVVAKQVSDTCLTVPVPAGQASVLVAACNGDGCGPWSSGTSINPAGPNPTIPNLGTPMAGSIVDGPSVMFTWNRIAGDTGSNTVYQLYVQDLSREAPALDLYTTNNYYGAYLKAEGARYDAHVIANPGTPRHVQGPSAAFNVRGTSAMAPAVVQPAHQVTGAGIAGAPGSLTQGNVQLAWTPMPGASLYEYYVAVPGAPAPAALGVTPGLGVQVPLTAESGSPTVYAGTVRACRPGKSCSSSSDAGWGPWSDAPDGPGVTTFTVTP
ncbi:MAG: fibronectin type III domain-containing protein [Thermoanaerobaculales bacterium]